MVLKYIELEQLSESDFVGYVQDNQLEIQINKQFSEYVGTAGNNATIARDTDGRRKLMFSKVNNMGILHIDFRANRTNGPVLNLPAGSPTPAHLIEVQVQGSGSVWIDPNARTVHSSGLTAGTRYIVDLIGFWKL